MFTLVLPLWAVITLGVYLGLGLLIGIATAVFTALPIINRGDELGFDFVVRMSSSLGTGFAWPLILIKTIVFFLPIP